MSCIETQRLLLRAVRDDDAPRLAALANRKEIAFMLGTMPHPYSLADAHAYIATIRQMPARSAVFAICLKIDDERLIGCCGYGPATIEGKPKGEIDFGYWIGVEYWGHGYATEAAAAVLSHAFEVSGLERIDTEHLIENPASGRVLAKLGFKPVGERTCHSRGSGLRKPSIHVQLTRADHRARSEARP